MTTVSTLLVLFLFFLLILLFLGLIKPSLLSILLRGKSSRKNVLLIFGSISLLTFILIGVISPNKKSVQTNKQNQLSNEEFVSGILFQGSLVDLSITFAQARVSTDLLLKSSQDLSKDDWLKLADATIAKWQKVDEAQKRFQEVINILPDYKLSFGNVKNESLISTVYAAEDPFEADWNARTKADEARKNRPEGNVATYEEKQILTTVDKAPPREKIQVAANLFHSDYETANSELRKIRDKVSKEEMTKVDMYDNLSKTSQKIETGSKVGLFIGSVVTGTGVVNAVITGVNGAGLIFDISETAVNLGIADKDGYAAYIAKGKDATIMKVASTLVSIHDLGKALNHYDKLYNAIVGKDGKITLSAIKDVAKNEKLVDEIKEDGIGNAQTVYDWGGKTWDFLLANPDVKTVTIDPKGGKVTFNGNKTYALHNADPQVMKTLVSYVDSLNQQSTETPSPTPSLGPKMRITRACSSGQLTVYTDCGSGQKISREWGPGKARIPVPADGQTIAPKVSGGRGDYRIIVWLENGESLTVGNYNGPTNVLTLSDEARNLGWTLSNGIIHVPN